MTEYLAGMMVRQKALDWWPYIKTVVKRINAACDNDNINEVLDQVFLDAAGLVKKQRKATTVNELKKELEKNLNLELRLYKYDLQEVMSKKRRLQKPTGENEKKLKESTERQYRSMVKGWPKRRERGKEKIKEIVNEIKALPNRTCKIISRDNVSLRLIYGGEYPAKLAVDTTNGWSQIR